MLLTEVWQSIGERTEHQSPTDKRSATKESKGRWEGMERKKEREKLTTDWRTDTQTDIQTDIQTDRQ